MTKCPRCEEGTLQAITFRKILKKAQRCSFCDAVWFAGDIITMTTGHIIRSVAEEKVVDEYPEVDQDHSPVNTIRHL